MPKTKETLGGQKNIKQYVRHKMALLEATDRSLGAFFDLMFSERDNVLWEETDGYKVKSITYGECRDNIENKTARLCELLADVPQNEIVGLYLDNSIEWLEFFWAILKSGYRPILLNTRFSDEMTERIIVRQSVKAVISRDKKFATLNIAAEELDRDAEQPITEPRKFANEILFLSSNTSNNVKVCVYTGEQLYYQVLNSADILKQSKSIKKHYNGRLKLLVFLPFYHIFGFMAVYVWFCFFSRTLVYLRNFDAKTILHTVRHRQITHIFAVPLLWETIYKSAIAQIKDRGEATYKKFKKGMSISEKLGNSALGKLFRKKAFKEVRQNIFGESPMFCISGGGYISPDVLRFINGIGYFLVNGYGSTETGITSVELSERYKDRVLGSVGMPFVNCSYELAENGELAVYGKGVAARIYAADETRVSGAGNTHDIFKVNDGRYYVCGRADDVIIGSNGENINPDITEQALYADGVERLALIPVEGNKRAVLLVEPVKYSSVASMRRIKEEILKRIASLGLSSTVREIAFVPVSLMRANEFKINRKRYAELIANNELVKIDIDAPQEAVDPADILIADKIREIFAAELSVEKEKITDSAEFFIELGGTSLEFFSAVSKIRDEFKINVPTNIDGTVTVANLVRYIKACRG